MIIEVVIIGISWGSYLSGSIVLKDVFEELVWSESLLEL